MANPSRLPRALLTLLLASSAFSAPAWSANTVLLQVGKVASQDEAELKFNQLRESHPTLLEQYELFPREQKNPDTDESTWRVLIGNIESRSRANRICASLKSDGEECVVVESAAVDKNSGMKVARKTPEKPAESSEEAPKEKDAAIEIAEDAPKPKSKRSNVNAEAKEDAKKEEEKKTEAAEKKDEGSFWDIFDIEAPEMPEISTANMEPPTINSSGPRHQAPLYGTTLNQPQKSAAKVAEKPVVEEKPTEMAEAELPDVSSIMPWNWFSDDEEKKPEEVAAPAKTPKGDVQVAEAIRVPVSEGKEVAPKKPIAPPPPAPKKAAAEKQAASYAEKQKEAAMTNSLLIGPFRDDAEAARCWRTIRETSPVDLSETRTQLVKHFFINSNVPRTSLRIGPLPDNDAELAICEKLSQCNNPIVRCRSNQTLESSPSAPDTRAKKATSGYWVMLGSANSAADARDRYNGLKADHAEIIGKEKVDFSASSSEGAESEKVRIRLGPYSKSSQAEAICKKMDAKGASCLVLQE